MLTRRQFLKRSAFLGAALFIPNGIGKWIKVQAAAGPTLDPATISMYANALSIPGAMPKVGLKMGKNGEAIDYYEISLRQFSQQILPVGMPATTVWSYGAVQDPASYRYPSNTIEAVAGRPTRVKWSNELVDGSGKFLPHLLTVDPTLHWANPPGPRDEIPVFDKTPSSYAGPVPMVVHLHGAHSGEESDGYPQSWFLPEAADIPSGYARVGSFYDRFAAQFADTYGETWSPGSATYQYDNDQRATALWFHDHTLGMTRLGVYAGTAGFYNIRGGQHDLPAETLPKDKYELPLIIQDRSFNADGTLFYPDTRVFFDGFSGPYVPDSDMAPFWNPETFGNTMVVNGQVWPHAKVEPRRYRLRVLNGCNARVLILKIAAGPREARPAAAALPLWLIGTDGGLLAAPVSLDELVLAPGERADVVVDFSGLTAGSKLYLINEGPDEPYGGGTVGVDFMPSDPNTTGQVLKFDIGTLSAPDTSLPPDQLPLPAIDPLVVSSLRRKISMNELDSETLSDVGPRIGQLGGVDEAGLGMPMRWMDPVTEVVRLGDTEVWEVHNYTEDAHPVHVHLVQFRLVNRESMDTHQVVEPEPWEQGFKDTILAFPGMITRFQATYDRAGQYVWHCHILEHEDNEMMRPMQVVLAAQGGPFKSFLPGVRS